MDTAIQNLKIGFVKVYEDVYTRHVYTAPKKAKSVEPTAIKAASDSNPSSSHNSNKGNNDYEDMEVVRGVLEIVTSTVAKTEEKAEEDTVAKEEENEDQVEQLPPTYREQMNQAFRESFFGIQKTEQQETGVAEVGQAEAAAVAKDEKEEALSDTATETLDVTIELPETSAGAANGTDGGGDDEDEDEKTIPDYDDAKLDDEENYNWDEILDETGMPATYQILQKLKYVNQL